MKATALEHQALAARLFGDVPAAELSGFVAGIDRVTGRLREAVEGGGEA